MQQKQMRVSRAKLVAYAGIFTAFYAIYGIISGISWASQLHGIDAHAVRAFLMVILYASLNRFGGAPIMGLISGALLTASPGDPGAIFFIPAFGAAGIFSDLTLSIKGGGLNRKKAVIASVLGGLAEAVIVTVGLLAIGFPFLEATQVVRSVIPNADLNLVWLYVVGRNPLLSAIGGLLAFELIKRGRVPIRR
jgi:hypothetical protein